MATTSDFKCSIDATLLCINAPSSGIEFGEGGLIGAVSRVFALFVGCMIGSYFLAASAWSFWRALEGREIVNPVVDSKTMFPMVFGSSDVSLACIVSGIVYFAVGMSVICVAIALSFARRRKQAQ